MPGAGEWPFPSCSQRQRTMLFSGTFCLRRRMDFPCIMETENSRNFRGFSVCLRIEFNGPSLRFSVSPSLRLSVSPSLRLSVKTRRFPSLQRFSVALRRQRITGNFRCVPGDDFAHWPLGRFPCSPPLRLSAFTHRTLCFSAPGHIVCIETCRLHRMPLLSYCSKGKDPAYLTFACMAKLFASQLASTFRMEDQALPTKLCILIESQHVQPPHLACMQT